VASFCREQGKPGQGALADGAVVVVLVVDDEPLVRTWVTEVLEEAGLKFAAASSGEEALRVVDANSHIGLVFTDVNMPGLIDGIALARLIRARWPAMPIILTSARAMPGALVLDERMIFIPKPYDAARLVETMRALMAELPSPAPAQPMVPDRSTLKLEVGNSEGPVLEPDKS
jgi:CheY-like chemotaxis protein